VILAALHDLALAGRVPRLAAAYAVADADAAQPQRRPRWHHLQQRPVAGRPFISRADVGFDRGKAARPDAGDSRGRRSSRRRPRSIDLTDAEDARWLRACLPPDQPERAAAFEAEMALAATGPPLLLPGEALEVLPDAFARVPADALPVVITTWALSQFPLESRLRFLHRLDEVAAGRAVAWVSAEGVGVAPTIPTLGDRRASGHSIIGLAVFGRPAVRAEAIGRCWSRGRFLAWLADS
jgi:hypothetical protein